MTTPYAPISTPTLTVSRAASGLHTVASSSSAISPAAQQDFERLFLRSQRRAYNLAYRLTGNASDAEDVTQDAYVRAWHNFDSYDATRSFEGWLFRIITNRVIDLRRRQKRVPMYSLDAPVQGDEDGQPLSHEFAAPDSDPETLVIAPIMDEKLSGALAALPDDYRRAILLCDVEQKSYQEIAEIMGCAIGTVRSRIHRARVMLRKRLETEETPMRSRRTAVHRNVVGSGGESVAPRKSALQSLSQEVRPTRIAA